MVISAMSEQLISVKIKENAYRIVKIIASYSGENISECLSRLLEPVAEKELERLTREFKFHKDKGSSKK